MKHGAGTELCSRQIHHHDPPVAIPSPGIRDIQELVVPDHDVLRLSKPGKWREQLHIRSVKRCGTLLRKRGEIELLLAPDHHH